MPFSSAYITLLIFGTSKIMVVVGLAQNFAAIRALCSEGIQRGHMSLVSTFDAWFEFYN
jgi:hydroxymethylglutaryl-CoA reductase